MRETVIVWYEGKGPFPRLHHGLFQRQFRRLHTMVNAIFPLLLLLRSAPTRLPVHFSRYQVSHNVHLLTNLHCSLFSFPSGVKVMWEYYVFFFR